MKDLEKQAEEFLNDSEFSASIVEGEELYIEKEDVLELMERFANEKAKALLEEAAEKATVEKKLGFQNGAVIGEFYVVNKESILSLIPKDS